MRGYAAIGLYQPKTAVNIGSALRSAHCYGAALIAVQGRRYERARTDTSKGYRHIPLVQVDDLWDAIPFDCVPVAVELVEGARSLVTYTHPERAFYVFGPEDGSIHRDVLAKCRDVVQLPTQHCLNLAVTIGTVLYDRQSKAIMREAEVSILPYRQKAVRAARELEKQAIYEAKQLIAGGVR